MARKKSGGDNGLPVTYKLRDDVSTITVCLYDPSIGAFTTEKLWNYILDCAYQLVNGEPVMRIPFHLAVCPTDAKRETESMQQELRRQQKENQVVREHPIDWACFRTAGRKTTAGENQA